MATEIRYNAAPAFRNTYFDDQGVPLIAGKLYSFKASDHGTPKPIYQSNIITPPAPTPPEYTNPIILDAGASVGPLFFASDENYYLELRKSDETVIATVDNWNAPENTDPTPKATEIDFTNYIANVDFVNLIRRKYETADLPATDTKIALPMWKFERSNTNATVFVEFIDFLNGQVDVEDNPLRYLQYSCTAVGAGGETNKNIGTWITDVRSLAAEEVTITYDAKSATSSQVQLRAHQFFGGSPGSADVLTDFNVDTLTTDWATYSQTVTIPSITGKTLNPDVLSALIIELKLPLNTIAEIDFTKLRLVKGDEVLEYDYLPVRFANGKTINLDIPVPNANRIEPNLWSYIYDQYNDDVTWAYKTLPGLVAMWITASAPLGWYLLDASNKFKFENVALYNAHTYLGTYATSTVASNVVTVTNLQNGVVTDATAGTSPFTVVVTQQGTAVLPEIFTITTTAASTITPGDYMDFTSILSVSADFYLYFLIDNTGTDPAIGGKTALALDLKSTDTADQVAAKIKNVLDPVGFLLPNETVLLPGMGAALHLIIKR